VSRARVAPIVALVLFMVGVAAACGGAVVGAGSTVAPPVAGFPVEVAGTVIGARPQRIVSASASHTEILYAIGAGGEVVATDQFSNYPPAAEATAKLDAFNLAAEAVAAIDPDLVILSFDPGEVREGLEALGIPTLVFGPPATLAEAYGQMEALGAATGRVAEAAALVAAIQGEVAAIVASLPTGGEAPTYYYELDPNLYSLTSGTFVGGLLELLGMENIADGVEAESPGYPQLSAEIIVAADPDFILLADTKCCGQSVSTLAARPGWEGLGAVAGGRVVVLDDDVASRWGPRLVALLSAVAQAVYPGAGQG